MIDSVVDYFSNTKERPPAGPQGTSRPLIRASDIRELAGPVERLIVNYPAAALASAFVAGVVLAWWIKRK